MNSSGAQVLTCDADHLATFVVGKDTGVLFPEDGMRNLKQHQEQGGIWAMRCRLIITSRVISVTKRQTGENVEDLPLKALSECLAIGYQNEAFDNVAVFIVTKGASKEMHMFQCVETPAQQVVDYVQRVKERPSTSTQAFSAKAVVDTGVPLSVNTEGALSDLDVMVNVLNECFEDIEVFTSGLQSAAEAYKELRRSSLIASRNADHGLLSAKAKMPTSEYFIDVFRKIKLSFNLLAALRDHITEPNAPELVHCLFTPLCLIVEASQNPDYEELPPKAVSPLLTPLAKELLLNCLTSKEMDMWMSLGAAWTNTATEYPNPIPSTHPIKFYSGIQPPPWLAARLDEMNNPNSSQRPTPTSEPNGRAIAPPTLERNGGGSSYSSTPGECFNIKSQ